MVLLKRLDYAFNGYQVPPIPQVPKSAKGKRSVRRTKVYNRMCAFDLLASVAGKLLLEGEGSLASSKTTEMPILCNLNIKQKEIKSEQPLKDEAFDMGSCTENTLWSNDIPQREASNAPKLLSTTSISVPIVVNSDTSIKDAYTDRPSLAIDKSSYVKYGTAVYRNEFFPCSLADKRDLDTKSFALVSSGSSVKVPLNSDSIPLCSPSPRCREAKVIVDKDDDENSSGCTQPSFRTNKAFKPEGSECRRKQLATEFWKVAPRVTKDREVSNTDVEMKPSFYRRKICYARQMTQRSLFKRRKCFQRSSISTSVGGCNNEVTKVVSSLNRRVSSYEPRDYHVKLSIKSFKVPELFIEIPETSTVASLKRTVLEAVTAILGGGLHVGVHVQGKKVRDDSKTLLQAGILHGDELDDLGFTLEPNSDQIPVPLTIPDELHLLPHCDVAKPLGRFPVIVPPSDGVKFDICPEPPLTPMVKCPESDHDSVHSPTETSSLDTATENARALIAIPSTSVETLPMMQFRKPMRSDLVQRRIRRPFSVNEVEALVQAVEKLGTGRWRDVKIRAFDNAKHRTYVDLKDKWKTLVHTARISPQQRRGEPVPQVLLDRVLAVHAYWTQQKARLQMKSSASKSCLLL